MRPDEVGCCEVKKRSELTAVEEIAVRQLLAAGPVIKPDEVLRCEEKGLLS